ncbi:Uncharacterised protein [Neisseria weaveri]|uniref:Uncharacterized protein n=2 Tax=Neisseria weaveri TaxID=28091 RepID=A0A448VM05_9NEIS|nr:hypothetical protein l13_14420 [Neisseria weaveri ATCC 51223]EGV38200.1 hypothetical protein l11_05240 [Neisseria weaveri LMG 5135]VEJ50803.1 Uncharacterised protein [Neisseria weaveri]
MVSIFGKDKKESSMDSMVKTAFAIWLAACCGMAAAETRLVLNDDYLVGEWWCLVKDADEDFISLSNTEYRSDHTFSSKSVLSALHLFRISSEEKGTWNIAGNEIHTHSALFDVKREKDHEESAQVVRELSEEERQMAEDLGQTLFQGMLQQQGAYTKDIYRLDTLGENSFRVSGGEGDGLIKGKCSRVIGNGK